MFTQAFGLSASPFQLTPDARFWFESATHQKAMAYLGYGLKQGEGFIVISGDVGAGKTTLVAHLLDHLDPARVLAVPVSFTQVEGDDLLRLIGQGLGIATEGADKAALIARVEAALRDAVRGGRRTLIIVDEAQALAPAAIDELRMLSNLRDGGAALTQILMLGQPEFRDRLLNAADLEQLRQRVIATHHLGPIQAEEVRAYLEHRLTIAGWTGRPQFSDAACAALHKASGGVPRKLNLLATRVLLAAALGPVDAIDDAMVNDVSEDLAQDNAVLATGDRSFDHEARLSMLETQMQEQDAALRRVLTLLIGWIEREDAATAARAVSAR